MVIRYPNGQSTTYDDGKKQKMQEKLIKPKTYANRGMRFEEAINESNLYYLNRKLAVIHKKPTPIQIVKVDYPRRSAAVIKEAYFREVWNKRVYVLFFYGFLVYNAAFFSIASA